MGADRVQRVFDALSSPIRREVLWLTWHDELTVGEIAGHVHVSAPTLSSHLTALRTAGLVTMRVDGNFRRYRCNRDAVQAVVPLLAAGDERWVAADALPERALARSRRAELVIVSVDVAVSPAKAFAAFTDAERYSAWLGTPVRMDGRNFAATMEWGTQVRGHYDVVVPPALIAMTWDFEDDAVPVPGRQLVGYLRITPRGRGSRVEVQQHADDETQVEFLTTAWETVLGRFKQAHAGRRRATAPAARRPARTKRKG